MAHIVSNTKPPSGEYGDEWFNPIENVTYKLLPASGTNGSWHAFGNVGTTILSTTDNVTNVYVTSTTTFTNTTTTTTVLSGIAGDVYWNWNSLLIDAPQSNAIVNTDASTNNFLVRFFGGVKPTNFTPYTANLNTYGSAYFNGTSDIVRVVPNAAFALGTDDYNLEFWVYSIDAWTSQGTVCFYNNNNNGYFLQYAAGSGIQPGIAGSSTTATFAVTLLPATWYHIAISRQSGVGTKCFVNGTQIGTTSNDTTNYVQNGAFIGALYDGSQRLTSGYMADFRLIKGTALYTSNFAVPTAPLTAITNTSLLTLQYNGSFDTRNAAIIDEGPYRAQLVKPIGSNVTVGTFSPLTPNNIATAYIANVNGGSAYFDGSGDYLSDFSSANAAYTLTGDFTAEAWIYPKSLSGTYTLFCLGSENTNRLVAQLVNGQLTNNKYGNSTVSYVGANVQGNAWNHIAISRTGSTLYGFANGIVSPTVTSTVYGTVGNGGFRLGADSGAANVFYGYISGFRLAKQGLYTGSYTPNTAAASVSTGAMPNALFSANNVSSVYFNGSSYLASTQTTPFLFNNGEFTIECWIYPTTTSAFRGIINNWNSGGAFIWRMNSSNVLQFDYTYAASGIATNTFTGSTSISANQWTHIAVSRSGTILRFFINGVVDPTTLDMSTGSRATMYFYNGATKSLTIGYDADFSAPLTGYISNLRVVKGTGLYTSTFTPTTSPLTISSQSATPSQVSLLTCQSSTIIDVSPNSFALTTAGTPTANSTTPFTLSYPALDATNTNLLLNFTSGGIIDYTGQGNFETANVGLNANITPKFRMAIGPFQRSGDSMISVPHDPKYVFTNDTNPFTIDYWIYPTAFAGLNVNAYVIQKGALSGSTYPNWASRLTTDGNVIFQIGDSTAGVIESTLTGNIGLIGNAWNHVAHTRNIANVLTTWVNGNVALMTFQSITMASDSTRPLIIGNQSSGSGTGFDGYLENIRVTKGVCRYTAPFTPFAANISRGNATIGTSFSYSTNSSVTTGPAGAPISASSPSTGNASNGEIIFNYSQLWTAPAYVSNISMVGVGGGQGAGYNPSHGGGGGGGLAWLNSYPVVAGRTYTVVVGAGGAGASPTQTTGVGFAGGNTYFQSPTDGNIIIAYGGANLIGGNYFVSSSFGPSGGGRGGNSYNVGFPPGPGLGTAAGGGGAGGYTGPGGDGGTDVGTAGTAGSGGGGGGGGGSTATPTGWTGGGAGGGVGLWGKGPNGVGGPSPGSPVGIPARVNAGGGGSYGANGSVGYETPAMPVQGYGGLYGGGGGGTRRNIGPEVSQIGGSGGLRIIFGTMPRLFPYTYTSNNLNDAGQPSISTTSVNYLIVAGGGAGGGGNGGGGGGAGGLLTGAISVTPGSPYTITVGAGAASQTANGTPSTALTLTATGGGGGSGETGPGPSPITSPGGSGGGGGSAGGTSHTGGQGITSPVRQGYPGGNGFTNGSSIRNGGGGGGAGGAGTIGDPGAQGGPGGTGSPSSITGTAIFYAGGGGGGCYSGPLFGVGGTGGGGNGGFGPAPPQPGSAGLTNRGGGGGGGGNSYPVGGALGGSGVVIISYPTAFSPADSTGSNVSVTTGGGQYIYSFYASGTITF